VRLGTHKAGPKSGQKIMNRPLPGSPRPVYVRFMSGDPVERLAHLLREAAPLLEQISARGSHEQQAELRRILSTVVCGQMVADLNHLTSWRARLADHRLAARL
jgi:hypothetical protein